ncbi:MAG: ABC-2 family transporter protein [Defluviitaleaceae bacterium]|nr:ABC-2 family transporter protein [Defluviitaleaceae bacterium]
MKLYAKYFSMHLKSQMQYKVSFFFTTFGQFLMAFSTLLSITFLLDRFGGVGGFSREEIMLSFAIILLAYSVGEIFGRGFDRFPILIGNGGFDRILVRPRSVIFQVLASQINFSRVGVAVQAVLIFAYVIPGIDLTPTNIFVIVLMVTCGSLLFFSFFVLYAAVTFFTLEGLEFMHLLTSGAREHGRLPYSVYGEGVLKFLTFVVPLALVQYYPLLYLTGREENFFFAITPVFSLLFLIPCHAFFRFGQKRYKSTGS